LLFTCLGVYSKPVGGGGESVLLFAFMWTGKASFFSLFLHVFSSFQTFDISFEWQSARPV
jgi:hypothetical protein